MSTESVIAVFTAINAVSVVVLSIITWHYARSTKRILEESRKARLASESQARAAQESLTVLRQQIEEQAGIASIAIQQTIQTALERIIFWEIQNVQDMVFNGEVPDTIGLVPSNHQSVIDHAMRISGDISLDLERGFEQLNRAENEIRLMNDAPATSRPSVYNSHFSVFDDHLNSARTHLERARERLNQTN